MDFSMDCSGVQCLHRLGPLAGDQGAAWGLNTLENRDDHIEIWHSGWYFRWLMVFDHPYFMLETSLTTWVILMIPFF